MILLVIKIKSVGLVAALKNIRQILFLLVLLLTNTLEVFGNMNAGNELIKLLLSEIGLREDIAKVAIRLTSSESNFITETTN